MSETKSFVCICCPRGCHLNVQLPELAITGNSCKRGEEYAKREVSDPRRTITSTVRTTDPERRRLPVKTDGSIPLAKLREAAAALDSVTVSPPVACGDIVLKNVLGLGVNIVATDEIRGQGNG